MRKASHLPNVIYGTKMMAETTPNSKPPEERRGGEEGGGGRGGQRRREGKSTFCRMWDMMLVSTTTAHW